jgi:hypothetical protein
MVMSRFGKFIELRFLNNGTLVGGFVHTYLLEKVRVVSQSKGERSFHVFYQLCLGATDAMRKMYVVLCGSLLASSTRAWRRVHGDVCMAMCAWRRVHGDVCMATCAWRRVHGDVCMATCAWRHDGDPSMPIPPTRR